MTVPSTGAVTPTCSSAHVPRYTELAPILKEHGIDDAVLQRITTPALLFVGSRDRERLPDTEHLASLIPDSALTVIEGADHASAVADSDAVLRALIPFLSRQ